MRPALYVKSIKSGLRHILWKEVSAAVGASVEDCKKRWETLRSTYVRLYKDHLRRKKKWVFFDQMNFLGKQSQIESLELNELPFDDESARSRSSTSKDDENMLIEDYEEICKEEKDHNLVIIQNECTNKQKHDDDDDVESRLNPLSDTNSSNYLSEINQDNHQNYHPDFDSDEQFLWSCATILRRLSTWNSRNTF